MIGLIIAIVAFFVASTGFLGGDIIYALDVLENWYYIIGVLIVFIASAVMFGFTATGARWGAKSGHGHPLSTLAGAMVGYSFGGLMAVLILAKIAIQIWLVTWLIGNIDPTAVDFDGLTSKQLIAMIILLLLTFIGGSSLNSSNSSNLK